MFRAALAQILPAYEAGKIFNALCRVHSREPSDAQAARVDDAKVGDDSDFAERTADGTVENDDLARSFEFRLIGRSCGKIVAVFVIFEAASSAVVVTVPVAVSTANDAVAAVCGNRVTEPLWIG